MARRWKWKQTDPSGPGFFLVSFPGSCFQPLRPNPLGILIIMSMPSYPDPRLSAGTPSRRPGGSRRRTSTPAAPSSPGHWLAGHVLLVCLFGILLLALLAEMPWLTRPVRAHLLQAAVVLIYTLIAGAGPASGRLTFAALRGPNLWLLGLLAWSTLSAARAPYPAFAVAEMLRLALGAGVYFTAAYVLRPHETRLLPYLLLGLGAAVGLYGLIQFGAEGNFSTDVITSLFGNHESLGSFLVLLLPLGLALGLDREQEPKNLLFAQGAALVLGAALLLARTRSAWIGAIVGLALLIFLTLRYSTVRLNRRNLALIIGPALLIVLAFVGLLAFGELAPLVSHRAATLTHAGDDSSFQDRLLLWRSGCRMASEHPFMGWGLGVWPVIQARWTHYGTDRTEVLSHGLSLYNVAHNYWVQWTAETGGVGMALHFGVLAAFLLASLRALPTLDRERRTALVGCLAVAVAGGVDMVGSPAYTGPGITSLFWVSLGLGVAMMRNTDESLPVRRMDWTLPLGTGLAAALVVLGIGWKIRAEGKTAPRGTLTVTAQPPGPVAPGTRVLWTATYQDPSGKGLPTSPGTEWHVQEEGLTKTSPTVVSTKTGPLNSGWQGIIQPGVSQVTATAYYWDQFSRRYEISLPVAVKFAKNTVANP